jgi:hypothetical protein
MTALSVCLWLMKAKKIAFVRPELVEGHVDAF